MSALPQQWLSTNEFLALSGIPLRTFHRKKALLTTRKVAGKLQISAASLPATALPKLAPAAAPQKEMRPAATSSSSAPLFAAVEPTSGPGRRIALSKDAERQARERLAILQPLLDFCVAAEDRSRFTQLRLQDGTAVTNSNHMAQFIAETHPAETSVPTLWRWKAKYEKDGLAGLARKVREDKGRAFWAEKYPDAAKLVTATYLQERQTKQIAYDTLLRELPRLRMPKAEVPSYGAVCSFLASLPAAPVVWAREGVRRHNERMSNSLRRGYTDIPANEWWVADTMIHDVLVRDDVFNCDDAAIRPQLTALMDLRSRKLVGYSWVLNGSSRSIGSALRMAVRRFGPAANFYCDNGKDFQKVARGAKAANCTEGFAEEMARIEQLGTLRQLGMAVAFCIPFRPQSKPVERFFRTLHVRFDTILPGYTTGNAYLRPEGTNAAAALHKKVLQINRPDQSPLLPMSTFLRMATKWIEEDYNAGHEHSGEGMNGMTPNQVWEANLAPVRPFDLSILDTLLYEKTQRKVLNSAITANKRRYIGTTMHDEEVLYLQNEREVRFCFDPHDLQQGIVTDLDGYKLCDVRTQDFVPQGSAAQPMIAEMMQRANGTRRNTAESVRKLRKEISAGGYQTAAQDLHDRSLTNVTPEPMYLPMAVGDHVTQRVMPDAPFNAPQLQSEDIGESLAAMIAQERHGS